MRLSWRGTGPNLVCLMFFCKKYFLMVHYLFIYKFWPHHTACRTLVPWPGLNPCPLYRKVDLTTGLPGKSPVWHSYEKWNLDTEVCTENALWILGFTIIRQAPVHAHTHTHTPQGKELPEARRKTWERSFFCICRGSTALPTPWFWTLASRIVRISCLFFMPHSQWCFVITVLEN